jgi:hypothetical protein
MMRNIFSHESAFQVMAATAARRGVTEGGREGGREDGGWRECKSEKGAFEKRRWHSGRWINEQVGRQVVIVPLFRRRSPMTSSGRSSLRLKSRSATCFSCGLPPPNILRILLKYAIVSLISSFWAN